MEDMWIMDSGCSRHMTGHRKWFSSLNPVSTKEYITFGDNGQGKVLGVGSISLSAKLSLREVAFVRNLGFNLVSVSQLLDEGFEVRFKKGACCVLDAEEILVCSLLPFGRVFRVDLTSVSAPLAVWLLVLRRYLEVALEVMTSYPGKLLHMDIVVRACCCGRFSRFLWVFFMESKDEPFGFVRDLVLRLRNKSHKAMRAIRSDNGGEFRNSRFENFCSDLGLEHQFFSPRTLVEMARTMLDEHRTLRRFWAEAVNTACYIANRIFLRAFLGKTLYELRFGRQPSIKHLRAFGCRCFVLKKARHLDKCESHCLDGIFLGYASSSRAFRVWILEAKQVVETCEISFDETMPCTTPAFELSGDDDEGTPIFEDEEGAVDVGDAGATAPAAAPAPSATSSDDEGGPLPTVFSSLPRQQAHAEAGPAEDAGEVTSKIVPSRQVQRDYPPHRMIGDIHQRVTRSSVNSLAFFSHSAYVASFEPRDVSYALSDPNWVNAMYEELENFERNHQMDVKSAFLNGFIEEEVYVRQPPGFESARFPDRVYKLRKALYGLKQAPKAWEFEMSLMGELQFFLGLQIKQGPEGTFVHQAKYTRDILKKFEMGDSKPMTTPMSTNTALDADEDGEAVDQKEFRGMIGSLLYLTATRPDIQFAVCLCARYQASPRTSHRQAVKRIFRYLKFTPKLGLWYYSGWRCVDNALIKGEIESQWIGLIALLV
ncbi:hypothetical protein U9M48_043693 [Paspalum notatum var. saurae]|uniref:Integrase catalytic domain-containing protein n=1 Tax=Paspalum notatum var. saurae TaxID=547442 RepID=A0AAQ3XFS8_PASNO